MGNTRSIPIYDFPIHLTPEKRALLMGFDYSGNNSLNGSVSDIKLAKSVLIDDYNFLDQNIYSFTDGNIYSLLTGFLNTSIAGDINFIHYSGHATREGNVDELVNEDLSIVTSSELSNLLFKLTDRTVVFIVDSCNSGTILGLPFIYETDSVKMQNTKTYSSSIINVSSSEDTQLSFEGPQNGTNVVFGNFSYVFYNYISQNPTSTWLQAVQAVRAKLNNQTPELSVSKEFLFYQAINSIL